MSQPPQVLIVGAGVTGSLLASMAREMGLVVRVLEKSRGAGGRMATHRFRDPAGDRSSPVLARADLGAQYISTKSSPDHAVLGPVYKRLQEAGVLSPFDGKVAGPNPYGGSDDIRHYTAQNGLQSIADSFLNASEVQVDWGAAVEDISVNEAGHVTVKASGGLTWNISTPCVVVMTQPVPQVLGQPGKFPVGGNFLEQTDEVVSQGLKKVEYSSRFATAYFFEKLVWPYDWTAHYFQSGDVRYLAHDSGKRGPSDEPYTSIVVHSGVPMGIELADEQEPYANAAERLLKDLEAKLPEVPWRKASGTKMQKWKYSQVYKGFAGARTAPDWTWDSVDLTSNVNGAPGCVPLFKTDQVLGLMAGDAFAPASKLDGCVFSAHKAAEAIGLFFQGRLACQSAGGGGYGCL